jgi:hypothetical protein
LLPWEQKVCSNRFVKRIARIDIQAIYNPISYEKPQVVKQMMYQPVLASKKPDESIRLIYFADLLPHFNFIDNDFISFSPQNSHKYFLLFSQINLGKLAIELDNS